MILEITFNCFCIMMKVFIAVSRTFAGTLHPSDHNSPLRITLVIVLELGSLQHADYQKCLHLSLADKQLSGM